MKNLTAAVCVLALGAFLIVGYDFLFEGESRAWVVGAFTGFLARSVLLSLEGRREERMDRRHQWRP